MLTLTAAEPRMLSFLEACWCSVAVVSQYWLRLHWAAAGLSTKSVYPSVGVKCGSRVRSLHTSEKIQLYPHTPTPHTHTHRWPEGTGVAWATQKCADAHKTPILCVHRPRQTTKPCSWPEARTHRGCVGLFVKLSVSHFNAREWITQLSYWQHSYFLSFYQLQSGSTFCTTWSFTV